MTFDSEEQRQMFLLLAGNNAELRRQVLAAKVDPPWEPEHPDMEWLKKQAGVGFWCYD